MINGREEVVKALMAMAVLYERPLTEDAADMLLMDLEDYDPKRILMALKLCRKELTKFPTVADIVKRLSVQGNESQVQELIGRIYSAISLYGYSNPEGARKHIGEKGWKGVMYFGGWKAICDYPGDSAMALRAQLRQSLDASITEDTRAEMLGLPLASGDDVSKPIENKEMKSLVFEIEDYR